MKIICAANMPFAEEAFRRLGEVTVLSPKAITPDRVRDADLLAIRSTTRVDRALLEGSRVRFVGTATIGTDHMDLAWLEQAGIAWCAAPGCNANSVSEYLVAALLGLALRHRFTLAGKTIGVIGVGNVGRRVIAKAQALGLQVLQNDPPRCEAEHDPVFRPLAEVLAQSDIVSLHVPLEPGGRHPTVHLADECFFAQLKPGAVFINAARGAVLDSDAFLKARAQGIVARAVLDTWEGEPVFRDDVMPAADIGTPHIAGHSFEGKVMGTVMVFRAACRFLGVAADWSPDALLPPPLVPEIRINAAGREPEAVLWDIVKRVYDIESDDQRLRALTGRPTDQKREQFELQRKNYPIRREFRFTRVILEHAPPDLRTKVRGLGFEVQE